MYLIDKQLGSNVDVLKEESPELKTMKVARGLIEKGWAQNAYYRRTGLWFFKHESYCSLGAIREVSGNKTLSWFDNNEIADRLETALQEVIGAIAIQNWNDKSYRTKNDVLAAFDRVIENFK